MAETPHPAMHFNFCTIPAAQAHTDPELQQAWQALVAQSKSPEAIFQTPGYFEFISAVPNLGNRQELVLVRDGDTQAIVGILPLRTGRRTLCLDLGRRTLLRLRLNTIALLGSIPLLPDEPALLDATIAHLFQSFPGKTSIAMQAVPMRSDFYHYLAHSAYIRSHYGVFIKDGWRSCHTTPLPASFDEYAAQFKAKKRYNLNRQLKLLEKDAGWAQLSRIEKPEQIPELMAAIQSIAPTHIAQAVMDKKKYTALTAQKIALCYVLCCGRKVCAVIIGIRSAHTYHVHNIIYDLQLAAFSPGTTILHLATKDLIDQLQISLIDYGYGSPEHSHQSANISKLRGHVFLYQKTWANRLLFASYAAFGKAVQLLKKLKDFRTNPLAPLPPAPAPSPVNSP
ncbi:GNAT family N-acetyltransferase [Rhodoferax sp.]|uniref:GNAT family N-acetyltransferase n=1 Tax=Rhodoferax sp. TaxID=50421 RepID=UPI00374D3BA7